MRDAPDAGLLEQFVQSESEAAFAALVERHINLVYSTALRHTANPHHAQEITQAVFIILARKARTLPRRIVLSGWLYHTARLTAANFQRAEWRRIRREQEAYMQSMLEDHPMETAWRELSPLLDEAMARLGPTDRDALVLRYFENKSLREVGDALGLQERAAQKRVLRGLEKLRTFFARRGVALTTAIIAGAVSANSVQAAPVGLAAAISATAAKGSAVAASTLTLVKGALKIMAWTKVKTAIVVAAGVVLTAGTTAVVVKTVHSAPGTAQASRAAVLFKTYVAEKKAQAMAAATAEGKQMPTEYDAFFAAAEKGNLPAMRRIFDGLGRHAPLMVTSLEAAKETDYAFEMFSMWDEKYALAYARGIIESIPPGSIYFTGVPAGAHIIPRIAEVRSERRSLLYAQSRLIG